MTRAKITGLNHDGQGITTDGNGQRLLVDNALPGEIVRYAVVRRKRSVSQAIATDIVRSASGRVTPGCPYFGRCGGCRLQHLEGSHQLAFKQQELKHQLNYHESQDAEQWYSPITGPLWHYRSRARLGVRVVPKKGGVLVGFRERARSYLCDMDNCLVLSKPISAQLLGLRDVIGATSIAQRIPQIETACDVRGPILVFRVLAEPSYDDLEVLRRWGRSNNMAIWLQPAGPDSAFALAKYPESYFSLAEFDLKMYFKPTDFTQVNQAMNPVLVRRAVNWLAPKARDNIADFFCGLGNFTLPIARMGAQVHGYESSNSAVTQAKRNAQRNQLTKRAQFSAVNLYTAEQTVLASLLSACNKILLDPPRDGALNLMHALDPLRIKRIVYVSCNPETLARDSAILTKTKGYTLSKTGVVNMFAHTGHIESIACFDA